MIIEERAHFDAAAERALISSCVEVDRAVIGICLGAQLVGESLGAAATSAASSAAWSSPRSASRP
ncbi:hypothetical protein [Streptomyces fuscichromogenes]|uniref:hypothetical protein n=1 Tax=Streptomyces fuscichromogenes TaxID=1324013 RepID=UPI001671350E|nr:hypothetical protein [Streptomyces fuscichromogenes]